MASFYTDHAHPVPITKGTKGIDGIKLTKGAHGTALKTEEIVNGTSVV